LDEKKKIESLFKELDKPLPLEMFVAKSQEMAMHLATIMDERKIEFKTDDLVFVGMPRSPLGHTNAKIAALLHRYYDEPDINIGGKYPVQTRGELNRLEAVERKLDDEDKGCEEPCPELPKKEVTQTAG